LLESFRDGLDIYGIIHLRTPEGVHLLPSVTRDNLSPRDRRNQESSKYFKKSEDPTDERCEASIWGGKRGWGKRRYV
jgi:hypothetical protein